MKGLFIILLISISLNAFAQSSAKKIYGNYTGYFGTNLQIKEDFTFDFEWHFDMSSSWTKGVWYRINDTIFLKKVIVYDTLILKNDSVTLVISMDKQRDKIYQSNNLTSSISSGGQDRYPIPDKLLFKNRKLFLFRKGKVFKKKLRGFSNKKIYPSWFVKESN